jgi:ParB-like chromosome segregation protein Spo0J
MTLDALAQDRLVQAGDFDRAVLEELGEPYDVTEIPLDDIDIDRSRRVLNQVRFGLSAWNEEHVEALRTVLEQDGALPPGIVHRDEDGHYVILSGNHRYPAHERAGRKTMAFYVATGLDGIPTTDPRAQDVALRANVAHGDPVSVDDRIEQAARLVETGHYSIKEAARALAVPEGKLRDLVEKNRSRMRLVEIGANVDVIPISVARRLNAISSDRVLQKAAELVPLMVQKAEETNRLVVEINDARTERDQLEIVERTAEALAAAGTVQGKARKRKGGALVSPKLRRLDGALGVIIRFKPEEVGAQSVPPEFREHLRARLDEAAIAIAAAQERIRP